MAARPDAAEVVRLLGGTATWRQVAAHASQHSLRLALTAGTVRRTSRGIYVLPSTPLPQRAAADARGLVSHDSAAAHWLLETVAPASAAHVTVERGARPARIRGVVLHWGSIRAADDAGGVTAPLRTVLDCAATMPFPHALAVTDSALRRELVEPGELVAAAERQRGAGRATVLRIVSHADGRAANPFESALRALVIDAGIQGFEPQLPVREGALSARVDLGDARRRIVLEADSFTFHGTRDALTRDCRRYDELVRNGWLVLRFAWEHVMFESFWVVDVVRDVCALADARARARRRRPTRQKSL